MMMKYALICGVFLLPFIGVTGEPRPAAAVAKAKIIFHGNVSIPSAPKEFADGFSLGLGGGVGVAMPLSSRIGVVADVDYKVFGINEDGFRKTYELPPGVSLTGDEIAVFYASLSLKLDLLTDPSTVRPYLIGGAGFFRYNPNSFSAAGEPLELQSENALGVNAGGGVEVALAPYLVLFLDAIYVVGYTENEESGYLSFRPGIAFNWKIEDEP